MGWNVTYLYDDTFSNNFLIPFVFLFYFKRAIIHYHPLAAGKIGYLYSQTLPHKAGWSMLPQAVDFCHSSLAPLGWQSHVTSWVKLLPLAPSNCVLLKCGCCGCQGILLFLSPMTTPKRRESITQTRMKTQGGEPRKRMPSSLTRK